MAQMSVAADSAGQPADSFFASAGDYDEMHAALRRRFAELCVTTSCLDRVAGLAAGHVGKILGACQAKRLGPVSLFPLLTALGLRLAIVADPEALQRVQHRFDRPRGKAGGIERRIGKHLIERATPFVLSELGKKGGRALQESRSADERSAAAKHAALTRWSARRRKVAA